MLILKSDKEKDTQYQQDENCISKCLFYVVFTPKYKRSVLNENITEYMEKIILSKQDEFDYKIIDMKILSDQVHLVVQINSKKSIHEIIKRIKAETSRELRNKFEELKSRLPTLWNNSYFVATIGDVNFEVVYEFINKQKNI